MSKDPTKPTAWCYENKNVKGNWYITWTEPPDGFNKRPLYESQDANRIEELERERDAFYMDYRMKCDEQTKSLCVERDALQADNAELVAALEPFGAIDLVESRLERRKAGPEKSWARSVGYEWRWKK